MSEDAQKKGEVLLLEQWKMASELHRHEDNLLWQRFSYFVTLTGILATGLGIILTIDKNTIEPKYQYFFLVLLSFFGAIISLVFASVFRRTYIYHLLRAAQAEEAERKGPGKSQEASECFLPVYGKKFDEILPKVLAKYSVKYTRCTRFFVGPATNDVIFRLSVFMALAWGLALFISLELLASKTLSSELFFTIPVALLAEAVLVIISLVVVVGE
jgi:hypothetical protein